MRRVIAFPVAAALLCATTAGAQSDPADLAALLARVGAHVEGYFLRAQSLVCDESVRVQMLGSDLRALGFPRRLRYEMRVEWDASLDGQPTAVSVRRELQAINGRPARPRDEPQCLDPPPASPEPLMMLLPSRQPEYLVSRRRETRVDGRDAISFDYRLRRPGPSIVSWDEKKSCATTDAPALTRWRVWADAATGEVLRIDEWLAGMFEFDVPDAVRRGGPLFWVVERSQATIRYEPVQFHDPDEMLMLPASIDTTTVARTSAGQQQRISQEFSNYRRFLTAGRVVE